jgi:hypothetical protein
LLNWCPRSTRKSACSNFSSFILKYGLTSKKLCDFLVAFLLLSVLSLASLVRTLMAATQSTKISYTKNEIYYVYI